MSYRLAVNFTATCLMAGIVVLVASYEPGDIGNVVAAGLTGGLLVVLVMAVRRFSLEACGRRAQLARGFDVLPVQSGKVAETESDAKTKA